MGDWLAVSGAFIDSSAAPTGPVAHCGVYLGPWPVQPPPQLLDCASLEFVVAVPGADPDDASTLTFAANPVYVSATRHGDTVDFTCVGGAWPDTRPSGAHLYVRAAGTPAEPVAAYVPRGYSPQGGNSFETAPGTLVTHAPGPGSIPVDAAQAVIGAFWGVGGAYSSPQPQDVVEYLAQQASVLTPAPVDGTHGSGLNYAVPHNTPDVPGNPDPGYTTGQMQFSEFRADFQVPTSLADPGEPADFASLVTDGAAAGHMPDGSPGYQWVGAAAGLGFDGAVTWTIQGTAWTIDFATVSDEAGQALAIQAQIRTGGPTASAFAAGSGTLLWGDQIHTAGRPGGLENAIAVPAPPGVGPDAPMNTDYSLYCRLDGLLLTQDATNEYAVTFAEEHTLSVQVVPQGATMAYLVQLPPYRYYAPGPLVPSRGGPGSALRLNQRNDGLGIDRHPRLRASNNPPTSVQSHTAPRVGDTLYR